jgi:Bacterial cell division membrane protein
MSSNRLQTDWFLFGAILALVAFGLAMVYSASSGVATRVHWNPEMTNGTLEFGSRQMSFLLRQAPLAIFGLVLLLALKRMDYRNLQHPLYIFVPISLCILMLLAAAVLDWKAHRWLRLGGFQIQPSEIAKPLMLLFLAWLVSRREDQVNHRHTLLPAALVIGLMTAFIGFGDLGTAAILLVPVLIIFWVAGIDRRYFRLALALAVLLGGAFLWQKPYRLFRLIGFVGITEQTLTTNPI